LSRIAQTAFDFQYKGLNHIEHVHKVSQCKWEWHPKPFGFKEKQCHGWDHSGDEQHGVLALFRILIHEVEFGAKLAKLLYLKARSGFNL
jgi:hypothetical protein